MEMRYIHEETMADWKLLSLDNEISVFVLCENN